VDNIEKSGFRKGEYVGYGGGRVWRISKSTSSSGNWLARNQNNPNDFIYAFGLKKLSEKLAALPNTNPAVGSNREYWLRAQSKSHGPVMYFTGERFSDHGQPKGFKLWWSAMKALRRLQAQFPLLKNYRLSVAGPRGVTLVNSRRRATRKNPETRENLAKAARRLKDFSGHEASEVLRVQERPFKKGLVVGQLRGLLYDTVRDGRSEGYIHKFRKSSRPLLAASEDGRSLRIVGGRFQFTEAGIEDR